MQANMPEYFPGLDIMCVLALVKADVVVVTASPVTTDVLKTSPSRCGVEGPEA
eukprot:CAMPEP_0182548328 /NCGR_PEP_ID=MMETSP1323-20130603/38672_1 /TAXON_ID=236787 /ORGANISM="Florenciella parvula, Strain RCC1693" /LENGTH=52 /DNA_ID=CAMNT_0024759715 /DNA_START=197 /DNA_END=355 /DNA_ORIENTATION=-